METILVLVYAEADGSLAKPAREALGARGLRCFHRRVPRHGEPHDVLVRGVRDRADGDAHQPVRPRRELRRLAGADDHRVPLPGVARRQRLTDRPRPDDPDGLLHASLR